MKYRIFRDIFGNYVVRTPNFGFAYPYPVALKRERQNAEPLKFWQVQACLNFVYNLDARADYPGHDEWLAERVGSPNT